MKPESSSSIFFTRLSWRVIVVVSLSLFASGSIASVHGRSTNFIATVRINNATIQRGQNGTVTVDLDAQGGADPENTVGFSINFDTTQLAFISAVLGSGATGASLTINQSQAASGNIGFALAKSPGTGFPAGTHQILVITMLSLANGAAASTGMSFLDTPILRELVSVGAQALPAGYSNGNVNLVNGCGVTIAPAVRNFSAKPGSGSVAVTATAGCPWTVSNFAPFVTITSPTSGTGNGAVTFDVAQNLSTARSGQTYIGGNVFTTRQGSNFQDVAQDDIFYDSIGKISAARITIGCSPDGTLYCPLSSVTREQMAAFIIRALGNFTPPTPASQRFIDVPPSNVFYPFIEEMAVRGITLGCSTVGPQYCPGSNVTREQMAAFIIRSLGMPSPPPPASQRFVDVPPSNIFYAFIEEMAKRSITLGCSTVGPQYCPSSDVTRGQMAAFLSRAFAL